MTYDEALALYNAGPKVVAKLLCDLSNTIESQQEQIRALEVKVAKLSKNSSNSSKPPSSDDITKPKSKKKKGERKIGGPMLRRINNEKHWVLPFQFFVDISKHFDI